MAYKKSKKKQQRSVDTVVAHVKSTFNNTIVTIATTDGDVLMRSSAGGLGYTGTRKGTPYAATQVANKLAKEMLSLGVKIVEVNLQGPGSGRDSVVRALQSSGLGVSILRDVTPIPHNGCRPPKKRRM
jgi:small subunit ribosomal protein S11